MGLLQTFICVWPMQVPAELCAAEEKRQGVDVVDVVLAFPITEQGGAAPDEHARIFAFLPVDSFGFRYVARDRLLCRCVLPSFACGQLHDEWCSTAPFLHTQGEPFSAGHQSLHLIFGCKLAKQVPLEPVA